MKDSISNYILSWVEENNFTILHIDDLVADIGYSRRTIETWFKEKYRLSLGEYILRRRLSRAAIMLRMTSIPVTDIAYLFHYQSSQGFSRAFKKMMGLTPSEYRCARGWNFDILQPSFLLSELETPELEVCFLNETFVYTHEIIEHDHLFDTSVHDITKKIKKLLTENRHDIDKIILMPRRPELGKSRSYLVEVLISYALQSDTVTNKTSCAVRGRYARMPFSGSWESYSAFNKIGFVKAMVNKRLTLRDGIYLMKINAYSDERVDFDVFIPIL
ncbi:helix-turn-helix transcriptional regulator [Enterobacter hormaechei]|nr:helix-turn-helix transcriptional regulator [Enterobacter hormaechei]MCM7821520.1 helix-turn-helix transcriptional regulator [Enterobacter hormaechei]